MLLKGGIALNESELCNAMKLHGRAVYRLALCQMQKTAEAEDIYQDVFAPEILKYIDVLVDGNLLL